jgi:hypothetical protein
MFLLVRGIKLFVDGFVGYQHQKQRLSLCAMLKEKDWGNVLYRKSSYSEEALVYHGNSSPPDFYEIRRGLLAILSCRRAMLPPYPPMNGEISFRAVRPTLIFIHALREVTYCRRVLWTPFPPLNGFLSPKRLRPKWKALRFFSALSCALYSYNDFTVNAVEEHKAHK